MAEEELKQLRRTRGGLKHRLTNFVTFLNSTEQKIIANEKVSETIINDLKFRLENLQSVLSGFEKAQDRIECICDDDELIKEYDERRLFFDVYSSSLAAAQVILNDSGVNSEGRLGQSQLNENLHSPLSSASLAYSGPTNPGIQGVRLPTINLPKFKGNYDSWLEFKDTFESLIHNNGSISEIQKFHYLRASLEADASKIIHSLEFTAENYTTAWELLNARFNNTKLLVHNHIKAIFDLEQLTRESSSSLRQLIDDIYKHLRALENLKQPIDHWDALLMFIITSKLDKTTAREWEKFKLDYETLKLSDFKTFLHSRANLLETLEMNHGIKSKEISNRPSTKKYSLLASNTRKCNYCSKEHLIYSCNSFLQLAVAERKNRVKELGLCENCLCTGHTASKCRSFPCKICKKKHSNLLHQDEVVSNVQTADRGPEMHTVLTSRDDFNSVLLSTAKLYAYDIKNTMHITRSILDSGSQSNFISSRLCQKLGLKQIPINVSIMGISKLSSSLKYKCYVNVQSIYSNYSTTLTCYVLPQITGCIPAQSINISSWNIPSNVDLADDRFNVPSDIDLLIGASHFWDLLKPAKIRLGKNLPILQETVLGWIVAGPLLASNSIAYCHFSKVNPLNDVRKFWEIEEVPSLECKLTLDEVNCEQYFQNSFSRTKEGRFIVRIPLKFSPSNLGESKRFAVKRMLQLEKRFEFNRSFKNEYIQFMNTYIELGHMSAVPQSQNIDANYYLPHHGVVKTSSLTTKLRVVFNGSSPSSSGWSVNDLQHTGPPVYNELFNILLQFRQHSVAVCSDIEKMYRQILVHPKDRYLQNVVWRPDSKADMCSYTLNTITYGTTSAPYLAIRCIKQLARDFKNDYPKASKVISDNFYVDDLIASFPSEGEAISVCTEVCKILDSACFKLRKWVSNKSEVVGGFKNDNDPVSTVSCSSENQIKTLGIIWNNITDSFSYNISTFQATTKITKRVLLSDLAKIFDPLGLLSPCTILIKIMVQQLWSLNLDWDDTIPVELANKFIQFRNQLNLINNIKICRQVTCNNPLNTEVHGFADASVSAYGACVYLKSVNSSGTVTVRLLCAKTRVSPVKTITVPRLELCAAVLLAKLIAKIKISLQINWDIHLWSDSQIVLHWLHTSPTRLNIFVANRVGEIQQLTDITCWKYINTTDNPADLATRGVLPRAIISSNLWWSGPSWLKLPSLEWPKQPPFFSNTELPELRNNCLISLQKSEWAFPFNRFSKLSRIKRVMAYCFRFSNNAKLSKTNRLFGPLSASELDKAMKTLVKLAQSETFVEDINKLIEKNKVISKNNLSCLSPFLDEEGLLRVGGRLKNSSLPFNSKHPMILNGKHVLAKLIMEHTHITLLHAGPQLMLSTVRQTYWLTAGMSAAKKVVRNCVTCFKSQPRSVTPIMAHLPTERVNVANTFSIVGIDYAGPFMLKDRKGKNYKTYKSYICLFVCFASKAIHLELNTDLTSETFLATLRRFVARRGKPSQIWSDNGTNFVGAQKLLFELFEFLRKTESKIVDFCSSEAITWKFIPPSSPHFGGLWECGVKNVKLHLNRVLKDTKLTFEEFYTTLVQIEATLNSRPLYSLSSDPNDLLPLTPSHFLIGKPLVALPDVELKQIPVNRLSRYQFLQSLHQHFWSRWSKEYLSSLQQRNKWRKENRNIKIGTLVLIKQDNLPPCQWVLGRICEVFPDDAGVVRVASVRTNKGIFKRAVVKLCPLPEASDEDPGDSTTNH